MTETAGITGTRRTLAYVCLLTGILIAVLDSSIANVALPVIAQDRGIPPADSIWIVTAYQIGVTVALLPIAAMAERWGFRRLYLIGVGIFTLASLFCAVAPDLLSLSAARALQGVGGAAMMGLNAALIRVIEPPERFGRAIGGVAMAVGIGAAGGPPVAAAVLSVASWHWLFLINVPIGLLVLFGGRLTLPETLRRGTATDWISALLIAATFMLVIFGLNMVDPEALWQGLALVAAGAAVGWMLFRRQAGRPAPMLPVDLISDRLFRLTLICSMSIFVAQFAALVALPFHLHMALGLDAVRTGVILTAWPVVGALASPLSGRLSDRPGAAPKLAAAGAGLFALGLALVAWEVRRGGVALLVPALCLCGFGFAFFQSPNNRILLLTAPPHRSAGASALMSLGRLLGQSAGAALAALLLGMGGTENSWIVVGAAVVFALVSTGATLVRAR